MRQTIIALAILAILFAPYMWLVTKKSDD